MVISGPKDICAPRSVDNKKCPSRFFLQHFSISIFTISYFVVLWERWISRFNPSSVTRTWNPSLLCLFEASFVSVSVRGFFMNSSCDNISPCLSVLALLSVDVGGRNRNWNPREFIYISSARPFQQDAAGEGRDKHANKRPPSMAEKVCRSVWCLDYIVAFLNTFPFLSLPIFVKQ